MEEVAVVTEPKKFVAVLEEIYLTNRKNPDVVVQLLKYFQSSPDPYRTALDLCLNTRDWGYGKSHTLAWLILKEFGDWVQPMADLYKDRLTHEMKLSALCAATNDHTGFLNLIGKTYELNSLARPELVRRIWQLVSSRKFKEAAQCVTYFKVQADFIPKDILIPCILEDRTTVAEEYMKDDTSVQQYIVGWLDSLCENTAKVRETISAFSYVPRIRADRLHQKSLSKLVGRWAKLYGVSADQTPNLVSIRNSNALRHLIYRRYKEKSLADESWDDFVNAAMQNCPVSCVAQFVRQLCFGQRDFNEAARWARQYQLDANQLPEALYNYMSNQRPEQFQSASRPSEVEVVNHQYLQLPERVTQTLLVVDSAALLGQFFDEITAVKGTTVLLGLDSEWGPSFGTTAEKISLIQVASIDKVYLIDVATLMEKLSSLEWSRFLVLLFHNERFLKMGFHFQTDIRMLLQTFPDCTSELSQLKNTICLNSLTRECAKMNPQFVAGLAKLVGKRESPKSVVETTAALKAQLTSLDSSSEATSGEDGGGKVTEDPISHVVSSKYHWSLSDLCHYFLGKPLEKTECFSNWARRPLRPKQIRYAAMDVFCELLIYDEMRKKAVGCGIDFDAAVERSRLYGGPGVTTRVKKTAEERRMERYELYKALMGLSAEFVGETREPKELRVVCDHTLQRLGKHLRRCGVDCRILENAMPKEMCLEIAKIEQRIMLTSGTQAASLAASAPINTVIQVPNCGNVQEQLIWVLQYFNVAVREEHIFSRCMICNNNEFAWMTKPQMRQLATRVDCWKAEGRLLTGPSPHRSPKKIRADLDDVTVDLHTGQIYGTIVRVQVEAVLTEVLDSVESYYVCTGCGKVYWNGHHLPRYMSSISGVLDQLSSDVC